MLVPTPGSSRCSCLLAAAFQFLPPSSRGLLLLLWVSLIRTLVTGFTAHRIDNPRRSHFKSLITLAKTLLPNKIGHGFRELEHEDTPI